MFKYQAIMCYITDLIQKQILFFDRLTLANDKNCYLLFVFEFGNLVAQDFFQFVL